MACAAATNNNSMTMNCSHAPNHQLLPVVVAASGSYQLPAGRACASDVIQTAIPRKSMKATLRRFSCQLPNAWKAYSTWSFATAQKRKLRPVTLLC
jgi:hypothetical protein